MADTPKPTPTVHPHIRGAYGQHQQSTGQACGSSPHTWGILRSPPSVQFNMRFIPTYVGHTVRLSFLGSSTAVHPHIRGAYIFFLPHHIPRLGSSPHTWGIPGSSGAAAKRNRFIPTYVGHTPLWIRNDGSVPVHPHIRGAYQFKQSADDAGFGSSPHTWGILSGRRPEGAFRRFIPTYVGHTPLHSVRDRQRSVHPHIRGAYIQPELSHLNYDRFIPTYVGHTFLVDGMACIQTVHPHIRGAYISRSPPLSGWCGSSPHTWGIPAGDAFPGPNKRFIPTYVGHTSQHPHPP